MDHDGDFAAYLAARWPAVVRTLVLLGCSDEVAEEVGRTAFARCYPVWGRIRRDDDIDSDVYRAVLDAWTSKRGHGRHHLVGIREVPGPSDETDLPGPLLLRRTLEAELGHLTPDLQQVLVLRFVADLSDPQVADLLDESADAVRLLVGDGLAGMDLELVERVVGEVLGDAWRIDNPSTDDLFREASAGIDVPPAPIDESMALARAFRRRRYVRSAAALGVVTAVVAVGTWVGNRPDAAAELGPAAVTRAENPAPVAWWANGVLHLDHVMIELPPVTDLAEVTGGAVYGDGQGRVVFVADDGARTTLGRKVPSSPLVVSDEQGWVAWVDPEDGAPGLLVYDLTARTLLARQPLPENSTAVSPDGSSRPIALDRRMVFYETPAGQFSWSPPDGEPHALGRDALLDVASATTVWQETPGTIKIVQPVFNVSFEDTGDGAMLSADGTWVLSRTSVDGSTALFGAVHLYDARSGDPVTTGLSTQDVAVAATFGERDEVVYVIAHRGDAPAAGEFVRSSFSGPYEIRTCDLDLGGCTTLYRFPHTGALPVLALP
ncbi:MAG TPA: hypothetical protein VFT00_07715 [Nocardioides sp.]|nr:hypothetical protein [Nocardioides sp.]